MQYLPTHDANKVNTGKSTHYTHTHVSGREIRERGRGRDEGGIEGEKNCKIGEGFLI